MSRRRPPQTAVEKTRFLKECEAVYRKTKPGIPMLLVCPLCCERHVDRGEFAVRPHHTHSCQSCGMVWRPAIENTVGVQFLPGFKDEP